ncbi:MAG: hypothetical protein JST82_13200 [Bacteroidetes bacterium]|nr:hypothetical protein [Bacteroidota bacterium]
MIEVFKTNVKEAAVSEMLVQQLLQHYPNGKITFDLEDCDSILRIAEHNINAEHVIALLARHGYCCEMLL